MEDCLKDWRQHIGDQRTKLYYLNHFTTAQLVILQSELSKVSSNQTDGLSRNVYPLLSKVKKNCCLKDLQKTMLLAFKQVTDVQDVCMDDDDDHTLATAAEAGDVEHDDVDTGHDAEMCDGQEFLKKMEDSGFCRKLALRALQDVGADDVENGNTHWFFW